MVGIDSEMPGRTYSLAKPYSCPVTEKLVFSLISKTKAPVDLVFMSVLSTYSILLQGVIDVERPEAGVGPVSLFTLSIAGSGERKSTVTRLLEKPIADFQEQENKKYTEKYLKYEVESRISTKEIKYLEKSIEKNIKAGGCTEELKNKLINVISNQKNKPKKNQMIFEDATTEAIASELYEGFGNVALVSGEGASILSGRAIQNLPRLNKLWSSESFTVNRKTSESFTVSDARLTLSVMAQPSAVKKFMKKKGDESIGIGFLARFMVCNPESNQGYRFIDKSFDEEGDGYHEYLSRTILILDKVREHIDNPNLTRNVMRFSLDAKRHWVNLYNRIESELGVGGRFQFAQDHGSKLAENIARIAALLSYIELGEDQAISLEVLRDAEQIGFYFSDVYLRCFESQPDFIKAAVALSEFFQTSRENGDRYIKKNRILQSGPSRLRSKASLDQTLDLAAQNGEVSLLRTDRGMLVVDLYPGYAVDQFQWDDFMRKNEQSKYQRVLNEV